MNRLLLRFLRMFRLAVDEDPSAPPPDEGSAPADPAPPDDSGDPELDLSSDPADAAPPAEPDLSGRIRALEQENEELRRRSTPAPAYVPPPVDPEYQREEEQLRQASANGATDEQMRWLKWQVDSNRTMRANTRTSQEALAQARDLADKADFANLAITNAPMFKKYGPRVEQAIADMKSNGTTTLPARNLLLAMMIGKDVMNGNTKPKAASKPAPATAAPQVPRGRSPVTRSDVTGREKVSERLARRERLRGQTI